MFTRFLRWKYDISPNVWKNFKWLYGYLHTKKAQRNSGRRSNSNSYLCQLLPGPSQETLENQRHPSEARKSTGTQYQEGNPYYRYPVQAPLRAVSGGPQLQHPSYSWIIEKSSHESLRTVLWIIFWTKGRLLPRYLEHVGDMGGRGKAVWDFHRIYYGIFMGGTKEKKRKDFGWFRKEQVWEIEFWGNKMIHSYRIRGWWVGSFGNALHLITTICPVCLFSTKGLFTISVHVCMGICSASKCRGATDYGIARKEQARPDSRQVKWPGT